MIQLSRVTKIFSGSKTPAVDDISLSIESGDIFGFLGPNGAGKTTTVKMIMGLISPTSGEIHILGANPSDKNIKHKIGFLPEHPYFYQYLTATEFLEMCAHIFSIPSSKIPAKIKEVLSQVHLPQRSWNHKIHTYSKGMQQRVGLAQALINDPQLIVLDEPMSGLDPIGRKELKNVILELKNNGKTLFFNSHILSDVEDLCTKIAIIDQGKIITHGSISQVTKNHTQKLEDIFVYTIEHNRSKK